MLDDNPYNALGDVSKKMIDDKKATNSMSNNSLCLIYIELEQEFEEGFGKLVGLIREEG